MIINAEIIKIERIERCLAFTKGLRGCFSAFLLFVGCIFKLRRRIKETGYLFVKTIFCCNLFVFREMPRTVLNPACWVLFAVLTGKGSIQQRALRHAETRNRPRNLDEIGNRFKLKQPRGSVAGGCRRPGVDVINDSARRGAVRSKDQPACFFVKPSS